jgi:succinoglycan biosynthesis protein ExoA
MAVVISYLVHDLDDPAVGRRVTMFRLGGADVKLSGYHRSVEPVRSVQGVEANDLGRTEPSKLTSRAFSVAKSALNIGVLESAVRGADVIVARNLEMLTLAVRARNRFAPDVPVVYECLDIHRLLLSGGVAGRGLRLLEDRLWTETDLLLTSSPGFIRNYFEPRRFPGAHRLVENKVLHLDEDAALEAPQLPFPQKPWRIGWFGVLRCRRSFEVLSKMARELSGNVEVVLRGRPAPSIFPDLATEAAAIPGVSFLGPYRNPQDLDEIYSGVHFTWAIDYYEASLNSAWLLPNRVYEGSLYGSVPLALSDVETGKWLAARNAGVLLPDPPEQALRAFFEALTPEKYRSLAQGVAAIPRSDLADDARSCRALIEALPLRRTISAKVNSRQASSLDIERIPVAGAAHSPEAAPTKLPVLAVIPCLNEAAHIEGIANHILKEAAGIPLKLVIADGGSTDGTREIAQALAARDERVSFLANEKRIQSAAVNLAVQRHGSDCEFLIRIDAHSRYPEGYCEALLTEQAATGADSVVVSMSAEGSSCFQRAAAAAQNSLLGNGGSAHRKSGNGRFVDHGHHALMRLSAFKAVGGYDETFTHNEDAELDMRLRAAGFRLWLSGMAPIGYFPRTSARALFLNYGRGRARTLIKHRAKPKPRQSLPLAVAPALVLAVLVPIHPLFAVPAVSWAGICTAYGAILGLRGKDRCAAAAGLAAMVMHMAWSLGFLKEGLMQLGAGALHEPPRLPNPEPVPSEKGILS